MQEEVKGVRLPSRYQFFLAIRLRPERRIDIPQKPVPLLPPLKLIDQAEISQIQGNDNIACLRRFPNQFLRLKLQVDIAGTAGDGIVEGHLLNAASVPVLHSDDGDQQGQKQRDQQHRDGEGARNIEIYLGGENVFGDERCQEQAVDQQRPVIQQDIPTAFCL